MNGLPDQVEQHIRRIVESEGLELVHIDYRRQGRSFLVRIDIDKEGGVNIDDCQNVSTQVSTWLDVEDPIPASSSCRCRRPVWTVSFIVCRTIRSSSAGWSG